jgi:hypothetical protein
MEAVEAKQEPISVAISSNGVEAVEAFHEPNRSTNFEFYALRR